MSSSPFSRFALAVILFLGGLASLNAEVSLSNIFGDHMVLQRDEPVPVWGWASSGETVTVSIAGQRHAAVADENGNWKVVLEPLRVGDPLEMRVSGANEIQLKDILVGEVWVCSGQSNMEWNIYNSNNARVEIISANHPEIRFFKVPHTGTPEPQKNVDGKWEVCSPKTVGSKSAIGYFFGRRLHQTLGVPIGLIDNSWGGSNAFAWMPLDRLEANPLYNGSLSWWNRQLAEYTDEVHAQKTAEWEAAHAEWEKKGREGRAPRKPRDPRYSQGRPANIYNGMVHPILGYAMRGIIWYQGEANAGYPQLYQTLFPDVIQTMRELWGQGDFPFYWVQLADYRDEVDQPAESKWAELREAQTLTQDLLPNTGQAVIIDVGEGRDIHPRNKQVPAERLVAWALANDYGFPHIRYQSPRFDSMEVEGAKVRIKLKDVRARLYAFDVEEPVGFSIAGADKKFVWANAEIVGKNELLVWSDSVVSPVAVRYGWGNNPRVNLYDGKGGLPVTPFRTDR